VNAVPPTPGETVTVLPRTLFVGDFDSVSDPLTAGVVVVAGGDVVVAGGVVVLGGVVCAGGGVVGDGGYPAEAGAARNNTPRATPVRAIAIRFIRFFLPGRRPRIPIPTQHVVDPTV
jgi:hypothetical protein